MYEELLQEIYGPNKYSFGEPGPVAIAIKQAQSDWAAGLFLYRIKWRWRMEKKLERFDKEWVAMSRAHWASESGLTFSVFVNRALPRLRTLSFVEIRSMKINANQPKLLWVNLDPVTLEETQN